MIEYWNERWWLFDYLCQKTFRSLVFHNLVPEDQIKKISDYIALSPHSNDIRLLDSFIELSSQECLKRIKDKDVFISWLPRQDEDIIRGFLQQIREGTIQGFLSEQVIEQSLRSIGLERVINLIPWGDKIDCLPKSLFIKLIAIVSILSESNSVDYETFGGYWTWGEGMKNEKTAVITYLNRDYSVDIYVEANRYQLVSSNLGDFQKALRPHLNDGIKSPFSLSIQGQTYLISILCQNSSNVNYIRLLTVNGLHERRLISREVYGD